MWELLRLFPRKDFSVRACVSRSLNPLFIDSKAGGGGGAVCAGCRVRGSPPKPRLSFEEEVQSIQYTSTPPSSLPALQTLHQPYLSLVIPPIILLLPLKNPFPLPLPLPTSSPPPRPLNPPTLHQRPNKRNNNLPPPLRPLPPIPMIRQIRHVQKHNRSVPFLSISAVEARQRIRVQKPAQKIARVGIRPHIRALATTSLGSELLLPPPQHILRIKPRFEHARHLLRREKRLRLGIWEGSTVHVGGGAVPARVRALLEAEEGAGGCEADVENDVVGRRVEQAG